MKMSIAEALAIAKKIDHGRCDYITGDQRFTPLWKHHFLLESYIAMLQHHETASADFHLANFRNVCLLMAPDFLDILMNIDFEGTRLDDPAPARHMTSRESNRATL